MTFDQDKKESALISWSTGKDSAYSLFLTQKFQKFKVSGLLTTVNKQFSRVAMHSTRYELLQLQAKSVELPIWKVDIPYPCPNNVYEQRMKEICSKAKQKRITRIIFGDIYLEDIRTYRETNLKSIGLKWYFPLWKKNPSKLAVEMISAGIKAKIICIDRSKLDRKFLGRDYDLDFLNDLPKSVDPCAERGEFHTFCYDAPNFKFPVCVKLGQFKRHKQFRFIDLIRAT
ncbi:MAG: adenine nucleotide alpha hydrolase [Planctomycetes bacterium]|nr:adenine nucleotide alpha hydrolase [Planctomycetota bacterium]